MRYLSFINMRYLLDKLFSLTAASLSRQLLFMLVAGFLFGAVLFNLAALLNMAAPGLTKQQLYITPFALITSGRPETMAVKLKTITSPLEVINGRTNLQNNLQNNNDLQNTVKNLQNSTGFNSITFLNFSFLNNIASKVFAIDEVEKLQQEIDKLEGFKKMSEDATGNLVRSVQDLSNRIDNAQAGITQAQQQSEKISEDIERREEKLSTQHSILQERVIISYKRMRVFNPILIFFAGRDVANLTKELIYTNRIQDQDTDMIAEIAQDILQLEADKKDLEARKKQLANLQQQLDEQKKFFEKEIAGAREYQKALGSQIAELSAKQQAIIASRTGVARTSVGDVALVGDFNASIGFKDQAPSNSFAVFSFGAYTHRNGMSQYGAKGRADAGQSVEDILKAYYPGSSLKKDYSLDKIMVDGYGSINFEDRYLMGIHEIPSSWHINALKAQAITARTYAVHHTNHGSSSICTTEACQVFRDNLKGGDWEKAVKETRGWILIDDNGDPISTQYASLHGGYTNHRGWDLDGEYDSSDWTTKAWDQIAESPWFYRSWYRVGYRDDGNSCGRSHPWLSQEEMADIINAWIVRRNPEGADTGRIQPITINDCHIGGQGGNPFSMVELRDFADKSKGAVTQIDSVSVSHSDKGLTTQVKFNTNRGDITMSGNEFKEIYNLRAPGYLRVPQRNFSFFNIEHKR